MYCSRLGPGGNSTGPCDNKRRNRGESLIKIDQQQPDPTGGQLVSSEFSRYQPCRPVPALAVPMDPRRHPAAGFRTKSRC
jgi:hypothetical protein